MLQLHCVTFCPPLLLFWWGGFFTGCHLISYMHSPPYSTLVLVKGRVVLCQVPFLQLDHLFFGSYIIIENIIMVIRKLGITEVGKITIFLIITVYPHHGQQSVHCGAGLWERSSQYTWPPLFCLQRQMVSPSASLISLTHCRLRPTPPRNSLLQIHTQTVKYSERHCTP